MAITTIGLTGFEHGYIGAGAQNGGGLFDVAPGSGWQVTTTAVRNGTYAARLIAPASTITKLQNNITAASTKVVMRLGLKVTARPASGVAPMLLEVMGALGVGARLTISSAGVLALVVGAGTSVNGPTIDTTNWHLIELQLDLTAGTGDWKVDGVAQTRATGAGNGLGGIALGTTVATQPGYTADYDDVIIGYWTVAATDWYGDGKVLRQLAGSDGTHATITSLSPGDAATAYSGTVTTAYTMVDDVPGGGAWTNSRTTTDNLALRTATVGAYAEIKPATTAETRSANAVKAIMSYSSSAAQANLAACDVRNSAGAISELWGLTGGVGQDYSETTNFFKSAIVPVPAAGWTAAEVNAIRMRFGGCTSADISPVPTVQGLMLEVDWPTWVLPTATPVARVSLASGPTPATRTAHSIKVRARKASGTGTVLLSAALYEGSTNRSGDLVTSALTTSFADYTLAIPDASAANITSYADLELRFWANSATGDAVNVEVARIALVAPAAAGPQTLFGSSSLTTTFGSTSAGQRRTTSQVAAPTTFGAVVQARRKTFGQVAAPLTVGVATQGVSSYPDLILGTPGLVSYWRLNDAAGNVLDSKGTNHGTVVGAGITRSVPGLLSRGTDTAMQGSGGVTSYVTIPTSASLDVTSQATVELWVRPSAIVATAHVINRGTDNAFYIRHYAAGDGRWEFNFYDANAVRRTSAAGLPIAEVGKRQHLVMTYDAAGVMRTYIDGVQVGTPVSCNANIRTGGSLVIFDRFQGAGTGFAGVIDEVALYNVVLTPQQVASHFAIGAPPVTLYGATATSVGFGAVTQGLRKAKGITAAPFTFGAVTQAQRRTTSALVAPFSFGAVTQAKRRTTGVVDRASTFGAVTQGQRKALGVVARASTFGAVTQAGRKTFSSTAAPSTFAAVTQARRRTTSAVVAPFAFGSTTAGVASTPAPPGAYFDEVLADNPIGYWRLGEPSGTVAVDQMGLHDGTYTGAPVLGTPGLLTNDSNTAMEVAGQPTQGVQLPNHADYQIGTLTLEAWVKTSHTDSSWRSIAVKQHAYGIFNYSGNLATYIWGTATIVSTGVPLHDGIRHHVVLVCQEGVAGGSQFYCDGVPVGAPFTYVTSNQTEGLSFGYNPASGQELFGVIDEVAIYGYTLTPAQIARHHQAGLTGVPGVTHYGSTSLTSTFGAVTAGQRKAFGQVARPSTFAAVTQAQRRTTGVVARATTFGATTAAQRKAFGVVARSTNFGAATVAQRRTTSTIAAPTNFGAVTQARRKTFSSTAAPLSFGAVTAGDRAALTKFGAVAATYTLARDTSARRKTFASTATPLALGISTAGQRVAFGIFGAVSAPFGFGATTQGRRRTTSTVAVPATFGVVVQGRRRTTSALVMPVAYGAVTQAKRRTTGVVDRATTLGAVTAARKHTYAALLAPTTFGAVLKAKIHTRGQVVMPTTFGIATAGIRPVAGGYGATSSVYAFGSTTQGRRKTFGLVARPVTLGAVTQARRRTTSGLVMPVGFGALTAAQRRTTSALLVPITFVKATQAQRQTFGRVAVPLVLAPVVSGGQRRVFAQVALPITFAALLQARRRTFGSLDVPIIVAVTTRGRTLVATVVLNDADMVYLSGQAAEEVAVGVEQVWPED